MSKYLLNGEHISFRQMKSEDLDLINEWHNNANYKYSAMMHPYPVTIQQEEDWMNSVVSSTSNKNIYFSVIDNETSRLLGFTGLTNINYVNRNANPLIVIGEHETHGKGIGTEILQLLIDFSFGNLNLNKLTCFITSDNTASRRVFEKNGFILEGTLKAQHYHNSCYHDVLLMSLFNFNQNHPLIQD